MDYQKIYDLIINKAKSENRKKHQGVYYESHHIIPKCMGGSNGKENKVLLTAREHYVCHKLLFRLCPNNNKLGLAYYSMVYMHTKRRKLKFSSREYQEARIAHAVAHSIENLSEETRKKLSDSSKGKNNPMYGVSLSGEKNPMYGRSGELSPHFGKKQSQELIDKRVETRKRNIEEKIKNGTYKPIVQSEESNLKRSESHRGEKNHFFNKKHRPESIKKRLDKMSNKTKEELDDMYKRGLETKIKRRKEGLYKPHHYFGKQRDEETKEKIRVSKLGKKQTPEHIKKAKENRKIKREEKLASGWKPEKRLVLAETIVKREETRKRNIDEKIANGTYIKNTRSEESNRKQSESMKGKKAWNKGIKMSEEFKSNRSGEKHPMFGKKQKPESIIKREATRKLIREERRMMIF